MLVAIFLANAGVDDDGNRLPAAAWPDIYTRFLISVSKHALPYLISYPKPSRPSRGRRMASASHLIRIRISQTARRAQTRIGCKANAWIPPGTSTLFCFSQKYPQSPQRQEPYDAKGRKTPRMAPFWFVFLPLRATQSRQG